MVYGFMKPTIHREPCELAYKLRTAMVLQFCHGISHRAKDFVSPEKSASVYERVCFTRTKNRHLGQLRPKLVARLANVQRTIKDVCFNNQIRAARPKSLIEEKTVRAAGRSRSLWFLKSILIR